MFKYLFIICYYLLPSLAITLAATGQAEVLIHRTPDDGLQPRLTQGAGGAVNLLYFKKRLDRPAAREGNLYYRSYLPEQNRFGTMVKVSSQAFNLQTVAISRAAMALDGVGRLHFMWYVAEEGQYFYARSNLEEPNLSLSALWLQLSGKGLMPVVMWLRWALLSLLCGGGNPQSRGGAHHGCPVFSGWWC